MRVLPSPEGIGEYVASQLLERIARARHGGRRFLLGFPTGRTPRPILQEMARRLSVTTQDLSHVVLVMMDEYLVSVSGALAYASGDEPWSAQSFARVQIVGPLNAVLAPAHRLREDSVWFPDPRNPAEYENRITDAGGIAFFLLACGATDGHVAFNSPGSARESRTRIIPLSDDTRRDNLQTFPTFGTLANVPHHGVSVGIATIASSSEAMMVVWGVGKRLTLSRMRGAERYDPLWPATVIHECARREIVADADAAGIDDTGDKDQPIPPDKPDFNR